MRLDELPISPDRVLEAIQKPAAHGAAARHARPRRQAQVPRRDLWRHGTHAPHSNCAAQPASVAEAAALLLAGDPQARLLAGGTDLVPNLRRGIERPPVLVALGGIADFDAIVSAPEGTWIGAGVTLARLAADDAPIAARGLCGDLRAGWRARSPAPGIAASQRSAATCASIRAACSTTRASGGEPPTIIA